MSSSKKGGHGTFDKDMHDFLLDMEVSAKRIIKKSNKKRFEENQRQLHKLQRKKLGLGSVRTSSAPDKSALAAQSTMLMGYPEKPDSSGGLMPSASMGTLDYGGKLAMPTSPIQSPMKPRKQGRGVSVSPLPELKQMSSSMSFGKGRIGGASLNALPSIHSATPSKKQAGVVKKPINKKLAASPLFSESMTSLVDTDSNYTTRNRITPVKQRPKSKKGMKRSQMSMSAGHLSMGSGKSLGGDLSLGDGPPSMKMGPGGVSTLGGDSMSMLGLDKFQALHAEEQGPISWSLDDLRIKYRGEVEREQAYAAYRAQKAVADQVWRDEGMVVAVAEVERHPIYAKLWAWLELENVRAANRARARNKMKRFVHDVHQIWMTNLHHLKEYRMDQINQLRLAKAGGRRDIQAILRQSSQIQSIAPEEAVRDFVYPTHNPYSDLDSAASGSALSSALNVRSGRRATLDALAPELPPPHAAAPDLKTLVESLELDLQSQSEGPFYRRRLLVHRLAPTLDHQEEETTVDRIKASEGNAESAEGNEEKAAQELLPSEESSADVSNGEEEWQDFPKWRIVAYDADSGRESAMVLYEADAIEALNRVMSTAQDPNFSIKCRRSVLVPVGQGVFSEPCLLEIAVGEGTAPPSTQKRGWGLTMPPVPVISLRLYPLLHPQPSQRPLRVDLSSDEVWFRLQGEAYEAGHPPCLLDYWTSPDRSAVDPNSTFSRLAKLLVLQRSGDWNLELELRCPPPDVWDGVPKAKLAACARQALAFLRLEDVPPPSNEERMDAGILEFPALRLERRKSIMHATVTERRVSTASHTTGPAGEGIEGGRAALASGRRMSQLSQLDSTRRQSTASLGSLTSGRRPSSRPGSVQSGVSRAGSLRTLRRRNSVPLETLPTDNGMEWEAWANMVLPLSIRVCGKAEKLRSVPGLTTIGRPGIWQPPPEDMSEFTRVAGYFFRDPVLSSTDSVLANMVLALDTPVVTPMLCAWDPYNQLPLEPPEEDPPPMFIPLASKPITLLQQPVQSDLDARISCTCFILTEAETPTDYQYTDSEMVTHRRGWTLLNTHFFRQKQSYWLTIPNPEFANIIFGVTRKSAIGNSTGVTGRSIWHSEQRSVEQLVKKRSSKDYAYVTKNELHHGFFDPQMYHVYFEHEICREIWKGGLTAWQEEVRRLEEEKIRIEKEKALATKIQAGQEKLAAKRKKEAMLAKKQKIKEFRRAQKAQGKSKAARAKHQWAKRYQRSELLATRNDWEMRRDLKTGQFFYHCLDEFVPNPDQWDPPNGWDEMPNNPQATGELQQGSMEFTYTGIAQTGDQTLGDTAMEGMSDTYFQTHGPGDSLTGLDPSTDTSEFNLPLTGQQASAQGKGVSQTQQSSLGSEMEVLVDELAGNSKLVEALAHRLGIPEGALAAQEPGGDGAPRREREGTDQTEKDGNIERTELDSDDDPWSDLDDEFGNYSDDDLEDLDLPQDHTDNWSIHVKDRIERRGKIHKKPEEIPDLNLGPRLGLKEKDVSYMGHVGGKGWRRLPKAHIAKTFYQKATQAHTSGPIENAFVGNTSNEVYMVGLMDPADVVDYDGSQFSTKTDSMFVDNIIDVLTNLKEAARLRLKKEELLSEDISLAELLGNRESDKLTSEKVVIRDPEEEAIDIEDKLPELEHRAILATKNSNKEGLEFALDDGAPIETSDHAGNTLLILAAQQGNKNICKFLLRRGAMMNAQNINGNTVLHYCYEYNHVELAEYLKSKGCDDSLLNAQGMTCYEGLHKEALDNL
mmetsp:Transcript_18449/g.24369  ORF Transcript_18449/g.24369 Transcript_18449/m.24369 type:complete len:1759 (+) Transcript_18449:168-5444(+)